MIDSAETMEAVHIRDERPEDVDGVRKVVRSAFGRDDEASLVDALRDAGDVAISLVAVENDRVVGHVLLSKMEAPFRALALAPVSMLPERHHSGIGSALIAAAIERAARNWDGVFVLGDPEFYRRFGFDAGLAAGYASPYAGPYFMLLPFAQRRPAAGTLRHAAAFDALG